MNRLVRLIFALLLAVSVGVATANCPSIDHIVEKGPDWTTHTFFDRETGEPVNVDVVVMSLDSGTKIEVLEREAWVTIQESEDTITSGIRISSGGHASVSWSYEECGDIIEPEDE